MALGHVLIHDSILMGPMANLTATYLHWWDAAMRWGLDPAWASE